MDVAPSVAVYLSVGVAASVAAGEVRCLGAGLAVDIAPSEAAGLALGVEPSVAARPLRFEIIYIDERQRKGLVFLNVRLHF